MKNWVSGFLTLLLCVTAAQVGLPSFAAASASATSIVSSGSVPRAHGVWYANYLWVKSGDKVVALDSGGAEHLTYVIDSSLAPGSTDLYENSVTLDPVGGTLFLRTGQTTIRVWSLDLDAVLNADTVSPIVENSDVPMVMIFEGLSAAGECGNSVGGIAFGINQIYLACSYPNSVYASRNKVYRFEVPPAGVVRGTADLVTVAQGVVQNSFLDLGYRPQDDTLFVLNGNGESGEITRLQKIKLSGSLPATPVTVKQVAGGVGSIRGFDIDSQGVIFYVSYEYQTSKYAGHQITQEAPTVVVEDLYLYPTLANNSDAVYPLDFILVEGSQSSGGVIGFQTNGHGGVLKVTGVPASSSPTIPYAVTFRANDGTSSNLVQEAATQTQLNSNSFLRSGYTFAGWDTLALGGGTAYADGATYDFAANIDLYAQWTLNTYGVTFNSQGGSSIADTTFDVENSVIAPSQPTRDGYTFAGWATTTAGTAVTFPYAPPAGNLILYAQWNPISYNLTFDSQGGTAVSGTTFNLDGQIAEPILPIRSGYTFEGWATTSSGIPVGFPFTASAGDLTLYAQWTLNSYNLTFDSQGGSAVSQITFDVENPLTAPSAPTRDGYTFTGWATTINGSAISFPFAAGAGDLTLYATWQAIEIVRPAAPASRPMPQVTRVADTSGDGTLFGLVGSNLADVSRVVIGGIEVVIVDASDPELLIKGLEALEPGNYDIELYGSFGRLVVQDLFEIKELEYRPRGSTKLLDDRLLKVRVFNAASGEKIQIFHNGREIAWVRTVDETDSKLHRGYLVRTLKLKPGKNVFEVYVDGERIRRNAYAGS